MHFVGRQVELEQVEALLKRFRFVSLLGPPGVGKTALALELLRRHHKRKGSEKLILVPEEELGPTFMSELATEAATHPDQRWLAITTKRLRHDMESVYVVGPMRVSDATILLQRRLEMAGYPHAGDLEHVAERLDGMPLALVCAGDEIELLGVSGLFLAIDARGVGALERATNALVTTWQALSPGAKGMLAGMSAFAQAPTGESLMHVGDGSPDALRELLDHAVVQRVSADPPRFTTRVLWTDLLPSLDGLPKDAFQRHAQWAGEADEPDELLLAFDRVEDGTLAAEFVGVSMLNAACRRALHAGQQRIAVDLCSQTGVLAKTPVEKAIWHALSGALVRMASPTSAAVAYRAALELLSPDDPLHRRVTADLAAAIWESGDHQQGVATLEAALQLAVRSGDVRAQGVAKSNLGVMRHLAGQLNGSRALHLAALQLHRQGCNERFEAIAHFDLAALAHEEGAFEEAASQYTAAVSGLEAVGDERLAALAKCGLAAVQTRLALTPSHDPGAIAAALAESGHALFAQAAQLYQQLLVHPAHPTAFDDTPYKRLADEVQLPARFLALYTRAHTEGRMLQTSPATDQFCAGSKPWVDLRARGAYRGIFALLCTQRLRNRPPVSLQELVAAGWPGETVSKESARNRAHVALSSLRRMGLAGILVKLGTGYALSPETFLVIADPPQT